jgi:cytochrome P450
MTVATQCPYHTGADDRKSAATVQLAQAQVTIGGLSLSRQILRGGCVRQGGFRAELLERFTPDAHAPVLFTEGEAHRRQRAATARFFAPTVVVTRYRALIERLSDELVERFRIAGRARLDELSLELAVGVAADIIGLSESSVPAMSRRLGRFFSIRERNRNVLASFASFLLAQARVLAFYLCDVRPAIRARRRERRDDLISHLAEQGASHREILIECLMYGAAGMVTTREFIVMAAWHLFEREDLRAHFLAVDHDERIAILEEILRLEPVVGALYRRANRELTLDVKGQTVRVPAGSLLAFDVRTTNADTDVVGEFPHCLNPQRSRRDTKTSASVMSFGDGPHRCPGAIVALEEAAIFLGRLLSVPDIRLVQAPGIEWNPVVAGYELRGAVIVVGEAAQSSQQAT